MPGPPDTLYCPGFEHFEYPAYIHLRAFVKPLDRQFLPLFSLQYQIPLKVILDTSPQVLNYVLYQVSNSRVVLTEVDSELAARIMGQQH